MNARILGLLRCPVCRARIFWTRGPSPSADGTLGCAGCGRAYPMVDGIPRLATEATASATARSFGFQWRARAGGWFERETLYGLTADEERRRFFEALGIGPADLPGRTVLDAGCGDGFLLAALGDSGADVVGIDISPAVDVPHRRCRGLPNVAVVQADVLAPPFAPGTFDYVWCEGVLVHTEDPRKAFETVSTVVKPGGRLYVWVYPETPLAAAQRIRDALGGAHRLPRPLLVALCYALALPLGLARRLRSSRVPVQSLGALAFALFDNLAPPRQSRHHAAEVRGWFEDAGFVDVSQTGLIGMRGTRA